MRTNRWAVAAGVLALLAGVAQAAKTDFKVAFEAVAPGVEYARFQSQVSSLIFYVVRCNAAQPGIELRVIKAAAGEHGPEMARRLEKTGLRLLAAINGDYFDNRIPWGVLVQQNEMLFSPTQKSAFMLDAFGKPLIDVPKMTLQARLGMSGRPWKVVAVNRKLGAEERGLALFTVAAGAVQFGSPDATAVVVENGVVKANVRTVAKATHVAPATAVGEAPAGGFVLVGEKSVMKQIGSIRPGATVQIEGGLKPAASEVIGGGPRIVRNGKVSIEFDREDFEKSRAAYLRSGTHPRSAVGYSRDRKWVYLVMVEGRKVESRGLTVEDLADLMIQLGAWQAMCFDGGNSADIFVAGKYAGWARNGRRYFFSTLCVVQPTGKR